MTNPPDPKPSFVRPLVSGIVLAVFAVIAFVVIWVVLRDAGISNVARLFTAMCVPPTLIALAIGGYFLVAKPGNRRG